MLDATTFKDVVSGRRRGAAASLARSVLRIAEAPYTFAVRRRNLRFDSGRAEIVRVGVPVVSIGNLTLGGTGKTPMVEWTARWFLERGIRVAIVSRGYGATDGQSNDEARELAARLPDVPHVQNRDRVAAAREAIDHYGAGAIVVDDGFQHRRLARDLDVVLVDATEPFGFDHVFPRGTLREPIESLRRAQVAVLTRADLVSPQHREEIRQRALAIAPHLDWIESTHTPRELVNAAGQHRDLAWLAGRKIAAFCGIGNPAAFVQTLDSCGVAVDDFAAFPDHFDYTARRRGDTPILSQLSQWAKSLSANALVATCKDIAKIPHIHLDGIPLWALAVDLNFSVNREALEQRLATLLPPPPPDPRPPPHDSRQAR
ncbi:MAG: tetraacyldisaccharide 4'-kinase [Pirellulales bacterium]